MNDADELQQRSQHGHEAALDDGLAFVNTLAFDRGAALEQLPGVDDALHWLHDHELLHTDSMVALRHQFADDQEAADKRLARVHRVRAAMRELVDAAVERRPPEARALERINRVLRTPYTYELVPALDGVSLDHRHDGDPVEGALARLAESIAREVSQGDPARLRICSNDDCRWVFHDPSPSGRRRWCDMSTCGNRAKAARYRERKKLSSSR
ncbi:MAG: CGNR zinc finger domain-containing protein [Candidatus Limnocylindrales bacterium]